MLSIWLVLSIFYVACFAFPCRDTAGAGLFDGHDKDKDGKLQRHEFIEFYENAARQNQTRVLQNMHNHNILKDLTKLSEIYEEVDFKPEQMPRLTISQNQD